MNHDPLLITFIAITALAVVTQGVAALVMAMAVVEIKKRVESLVDETRQHVHPVLASTRNILDSVSPRLDRIGDNLVEVTDIAKQQAQNVGVTLDDLLARTQRQAAHVEKVASQTIQSVESTRNRVERIVDTPLRVVSGVTSGVIAGVERLFSAARPPKNRRQWVPEMSAPPSVDVPLAETTPSHASKPKY